MHFLKDRFSFQFAVYSQDLIALFWNKTKDMTEPDALACVIFFEKAIFTKESELSFSWHGQGWGWGGNGRCKPKPEAKSLLYPNCAT